MYKYNFYYECDGEEKIFVSEKEQKLPIHSYGQILEQEVLIFENIETEEEKINRGYIPSWSTLIP